MNSKKINALLALLRPINAIIVFLTIVAAALYAGATFEQWLFVLLASLAGACIAGGGYAINDFFDIEIDKINRPERPLPQGLISKEAAWWVWRVSSSIGVLLSAYVGPWTFTIALVWVISLYIYSKTLKRKVFVGNLVVGIATGLAFVYGAVAVGEFERAIIPAVFALLINLARELVKDIEDRKGDAHGKAQTLAVKHGVKPALGLATLIIVLLIMATVLPYSSGLYNARYFALVLVVDALLVYIVVSMWRNWAPKNLARLSMLLKLDMVLGLVAIFIGS